MRRKSVRSHRQSCRWLPCISFFGNNIRKIFALASVMAVFFLTASFSFAEGESLELSEDQFQTNVFLETNDGTVALDELDLPDFQDESSSEEGAETHASMQDLESAIDRIKKSSENPGSETDHTPEGGIRVYDEASGGYVSADYEEDWSLILINKDNPIPEDYEFELTTIRGAIRSDIRVAPHVLELLKAAKEDGLTIYICSPYRNPEKQQKLFNKKMRTYIRKGMSEEEAYDLASQTVAIPGTSEHQAGLAFDFISKDHQMLDEAFGETPEGQWLKEHCAEYGFILRYPLGLESVTEIEFEPWHCRYVGETAAKEIMSRGIPLEGYDKEIGLTE